MPSQLNATKWVSDYSDMLYRFALPRVNDAEIAKDLVQDTFLAAWRNYENFKGEISEKNWLYAILKNKIIDHFRKASTRLTDSLPGMADEENYFDEVQHWTQTTAPNEWNTDSNSPIEKKEFYEILRKCKARLKDIQNTVFTLKYLEGLDSEEICKELNITASNYWVLIHRAKLQLRACLEKNWFIK
ncbi:MAG: sigma-70 family RNA polymerase sigma factor [Panacibacter sp.]